MLVKNKDSIEFIVFFSIFQNNFSFWTHLKNQQTDEELDYEQNLLVLIHQDNSTNKRFRLVYRTDSDGSETVSKDSLDEGEPVFISRSSQRPDGPVLELDQQQILMLEDDEVVRRAAASLYQKHPTVSSLYAVDPQQRVQQVKGQAGLLSDPSSNSRLVLVGHGARDHSGEMRISGYSSKDVARIIQSSSRISQKIQTTTVVACDVGSDRRFREALLKKLHEAGMETELHLWNTVVQVAETGEVLSQDGAEWRCEDDSKKVVLTVDRNGEIRTRKDRHHRGHTVHTDQRTVLGKGQTDKESSTLPPKSTVNPRFLVYRHSWPNKLQTFVPVEVFNTFSDQLKQNIEASECLSWELFHSDQPKPDKVDVKSQNFNFRNYVIGKTEKNGKIEQLTEKEDVEKRLNQSYEIKSGSDIRRIIRHFAKDGEDDTTYLMVNNWIYEVDPQNLYVYPVGKKLDNNQGQEQSILDYIRLFIKQIFGQEEKNIKNSIEAQIGKSDYPRIKEGLHSSTKNAENTEEQCAQYFRDIFQAKKAAMKPLLAEAWCTTYFVASVISESARNFRTFPLILIALEMTETKKNMRDGLSFLFHEHPMARGGSWIDPSRRGFRGSAIPEGSSKLQNKKKSKIEKLYDDLKNVIYREDMMFSKWKEVLGNNLGSETILDKMAEIAEHYKVIHDKQEFKNDCGYFEPVPDPKEKATISKNPG